jgi:hypothetical protein
MKLAKALKKKNQYIIEINSLKEKIKKFNSYILTDKVIAPKINVREKLKELEIRKKQLITIKSEIAKANVENNLQPLIFELAELKDSLSYWNSLEIKCGIEVKEAYFGSSESAYNYMSIVKEEERESIVNNIKIRIEEIQDKLDELNATIEINIE